MSMLSKLAPAGGRLVVGLWPSRPGYDRGTPQDSRRYGEMTEVTTARIACAVRKDVWPIIELWRSSRTRPCGRTC